MTSDQSTGFGFSWGNKPQSANQPSAPAWGTPSTFGQSQASQPNAFTTSFQNVTQNPNPQSSGFGSAQGSSGSNPFSGMSSQPHGVGSQPGNPFQQSSTFGQQNPPPTNTFGRQSSASQSTSGFGFGSNQGIQSNTMAQPFGQSHTQSGTTSGVGFSSIASHAQPSQSNLFGRASNTQPTGGFGSSSTQFGASSGASQASTGFGFGQQTNASFGQTAKPAFGFGSGQATPSNTSSNTFGQFGMGTNRPSTGFGFGSNTGGMQSISQPNTGFGFGSSASAQPATAPAFGQPSTASAPSTGSQFGSTTAAPSAPGNPFQQQTIQTNPSSSGFSFGSVTATQPSTQSSPFGTQPTASTQQSGGLFGTASTAPGTFGRPASAQSSSGFQFGQASTSTAVNQLQQQNIAPTSTTGQFSFASQSTTGTGGFGGSASQPGGIAQAGTGFGFGARPGGATQSATQPSLGSGTAASPFSFGASTGTQSTTTQSQQTTGFGTTSTGFGGLSSMATGPATSQTTTLGGFGKPNTFGMASTTLSTTPTAFGTPQSTTSFGTSTTSGPSSIFGARNSATPTTTSTATPTQPEAKPAAPFSFSAIQPAPTATSSTTTAPFPSVTPSTQSSSGGLFSTQTTTAPAPPSQTMSFASASGTPSHSITTSTQAASSAITPVATASVAQPNLFSLDATADVSALSQTIRSDYVFIPRGEFEEFHPLLQKLLELDSRTRPSHPQYRSRGFLVDPCDAKKVEDMKKAMEESNADVQDVVMPDAIRSEWSNAAETAASLHEPSCPVPCVGAHTLHQRCVAQKKAIDGHTDELRGMLADIDGLRNKGVVGQQWIDEHCEKTVFALHTNALRIFKQLTMLRHKGEKLTEREKELLGEVSELRSILRGDAVALNKYSCWPEFVQILHAKAPLIEAVEGIIQQVEQIASTPARSESADPSEIEVSAHTENLLESLEEVRDGTKTLLEILSVDKAMVARIENSGRRP